MGALSDYEDEKAGGQRAEDRRGGDYSGVDRSGQEALEQMCEEQVEGVAGGMVWGWPGGTVWGWPEGWCGGGGRWARPLLIDGGAGLARGFARGWRGDMQPVADRNIITG